MGVMANMKAKLSKRLLMTVVTGVAVPAMLKWGIPEETVNWIVGLVGAYVLGETIRPSGIAAVAKTEKLP